MYEQLLKRCLEMGLRPGVELTWRMANGSERTGRLVSLPQRTQQSLVVKYGPPRDPMVLRVKLDDVVHVKAKRREVGQAEVEQAVEALRPKGQRINRPQRKA